MNFKKSLKKSQFFILLRIFYGLKKTIWRSVTLTKIKNVNNKIFSSKSLNFKHSFCGYYDFSPFNKDNESLIILHSTNSSILRNPNPYSSVSIRIFDWKKNKIYRELGQSFSWNWQQGSRAIFFNKDKWCYNFYCNKLDKYFAKIGFIDGGKEEIIPYPMQELSVKNKFYTICYDSLAYARKDYGYFNRNYDENILLSNKIIEFDLETGNEYCISDIVEDKCVLENFHKSKITKFKYNHLKTSPSGNILAYLFRYNLFNIKYTELIIYDLTKRLIIKKIIDYYVSHYCWISDDEMIFTGLHNNMFGYFYFNITDDSIEFLFPCVDGHPSLLCDGNILSDTYANNKAVRKLFCFNFKNKSFKNSTNIASFIEPFYLWGSRRCDLHPSASPSKHYWQVDCMYLNKRSICIGELT